jgi:hypothetical protein
MSAHFQPAHENLAGNLRHLTHVLLLPPDIQKRLSGKWSENVQTGKQAVKISLVSPRHKSIHHNRLQHMSSVPGMHLQQSTKFNILVEQHPPLPQG